jgi:hypothetical protein
MPKDMEGHAVRYRDVGGRRCLFKPNVEPAVFPKSKELASSLETARVTGERRDKRRWQMRKPWFSVLCVTQINPRLGKVHIRKIRCEPFG